MTTLFLVRHGAHDRLGRFLDGRNPGVSLSGDGRRQADRVAARLARERVDAVYASPLERTRETAAPIAARHGLAVTVDPALAELDFGAWAGMTFEALQPLEAWQRWNTARSTARTPAGDTMRAAQTRLLDFIDARRQAAPQGSFVLVSHADPLKAIVTYYLGLSLDDLPRFAVAPGSLSRIDVEPWGAHVVTLNEVTPDEVTPDEVTPDGTAAP